MKTFFWIALLTTITLSACSLVEAQKAVADAQPVIAKAGEVVKTVAPQTAPIVETVNTVSFLVNLLMTAIIGKSAMDKKKLQEENIKLWAANTSQNPV